MCHRIRADVLSGVGLLDLVRTHSWHFAARDATRGAYAADFALQEMASCSSSATSRSTTLLRRPVDAGRQESPRRHDPNVFGLEQEAASNVLHVLLEDDGAFFPVSDCLHDGWTSSTEFPAFSSTTHCERTVTLVLISTPLASWHGFSCMLWRCPCPEGHVKGAVDGHFGCRRRWANRVTGNKVSSSINANTKGLIEMAKDARKHVQTAPIRELIEFTPPPKSDIPSKVFDTVSLRQDGTGTKANCAWSSKLVDKAPMVYYHGVIGKAASKHWRPTWVAATRAIPDDDAVADMSGQWRGW